MSVFVASIGISEVAWANDEASDESSIDTTVVVTGSRTDGLHKDSVVATQLIDRETIDRSGASTVADLFRSQAGVSFERSFAGTSVRLQGLNPEHVLILIDGQRVVGRKNGSIDLSRYPVDWIERIEIVKGPSSVLYGADAMGGVINLITRRADGPFSADLYTSYGTPGDLDGSGSVALQRGKIGTRTHGGYHALSAYDLDPSTPATDGPDRTTFHAGNVTDIQVTPDWRITPRVSYRQEDKRGISESASGAVYDDRNLSEEVQAAVGSDTWLSTDDHLRITLFTTWYRDQFNSDQRKSDAQDSYQDTRELLVQGSVQYDRSFGDQHLSSVGVDVLEEEMDSGRLASGEGSRRRVGIFLQDQWTLPTDKFFVIMPGARVDFDSQFGVHPTPRLALRFDPDPDVVLRASVGWGYRAPSFKELLMRFQNASAGYVVEGNTELEPETSRNVSASVDWQASEAVGLSVAGYRNDVRDLIDFGTLDEGGASSSVRYGYINVAEAITQGGEANLIADLWTGFTISGGYTYSHTLNVQENRPLEGRPVHRVSGELYQSIEQTDTTLSLRGSWNGSKAFFIDTDGDGEEERLDSDPSTLIDARVSQDIGLGRTGIRVFAGVENILSEGDPDHLPIAPRTYFVGLTGRFPTRPQNQGALAQ